MEGSDWFYHLEWPHWQRELHAPAADHRRLREAVGASAPAAPTGSSVRLGSLLLTILLGEGLLWSLFASIPWR
jgi:hypothetical protein